MVISAIWKSALAIWKLYVNQLKLSHSYRYRCSFGHSSRREIQRHLRRDHTVATSDAAPAPARGAAVHAPTYAPEVQARGGESLYRAERLPQSGAVRPEYEKSGQWIAQPGT